MHTLPRDNTGKLPSYAWSGGYPFVYYDKVGNVLCPSCANKEVDQSQEVIAADINYEDVELFCDDCSKRIEAAYE